MASLAFRTTLNLAFCYHKLGSYNSSVRTLIFLLNELNPEIFEAICEGIKVDEDLPASQAILAGFLPKVVYRLCLSLKELKMYEKCQDKAEVLLDYLRKLHYQLEKVEKSFESGTNISEAISKAKQGFFGSGVAKIQSLDDDSFKNAFEALKKELKGKIGDFS